MSAHYGGPYYGSNLDPQIAQNRAQVDDLTNIMQRNLELAMQRDVNLNNLQYNIEDLDSRANDFRTSAVRTKKWYQWLNLKWTIIIIIVVVIILLLLALAIGLGVGLTKKN